MDSWQAKNAEYRQAQERARKQRYKELTTLPEGEQKTGPWSHTEERLLIVSQDSLLSIACALGRTYSNVAHKWTQLKAQGKV